MPARRRRLTRREIDRRLGYTGLGVGAVGFVLVLVASLVVIEVAPRIDPSAPFAARGQSVVRYPALEVATPVDRVDRVVRVDRQADAGPVERRQPVPAAPDTGAVAETPDLSDTPGGPGEPGEPDTEGGSGGDGGTPRDPGTPAVEGPVSQTVDPVVDGLLGAVDGTTGGASAPVTGPAGGLVDGVTDLGDGLLGRP